MIYFGQQINVFQQAKDAMGNAFENVFNVNSVLVLFALFLAAYILGKIIGAILRKVTNVLGTKIDSTKDLNQVNRLRRLETFIVLSIALIRGFLFAGAIYVWWIYTHPGGQPTALVTASAVVAIIGAGAVIPILRDLTYGSIMMAEHWFGVGDFIRVEPFGELQGIVDRVTLRSTRIRSINGEVIWINNQNIQAVRIAPKGIRMLALDLLVSDLERGIALIEKTNQHLPTSPVMLVRPLTIIAKQAAGNSNKLWHITAVGETAPGREWLLEDYAIKIMTEIDKKSRRPILLHEPVARYSDADAESRFARTIKNASKQPIKRQIPLASSLHPKPKSTTKPKKIIQ